jgi:LPXTG-motif cell wall-anchored protein
MNIALPSSADVANSLIVIGAAVLAALGWLFLFRSKLMHRHKYHRRRRRSQRKLNPTLAQTGGLPPLREEKKSADQTPPP